MWTEKTQVLLAAGWANKRYPKLVATILSNLNRFS